MRMSTGAGDRLGQYELAEVLGRGGMATVYRARQPSLGRDVAIKVLHEHLDGQAALRFEREARSVARLQHPNILPVYDYGEQDGRRYIVTQYVPGGRTLAHLVAGGPLPAARVLALAERLLDALAYAHHEGVIHRDIKPANVMLPRDDWPLLGDFGIAEILSSTTQLTPAGQIIGTPAYMAPERASDGPADPRSDLYAIGVVLYELLAGRPPFEADSALAVVMQHLSEEPSPLGALMPGLPAGLAAAVHTALAKSPAERFQSAEAMAAALRTIGLSPAPAANTLPPPRPPAAEPPEQPVPAQLPPAAVPLPGQTTPLPAAVPPSPARREEPSELTPGSPLRRRVPWPLVLLAALLLAGAVVALALRAGHWGGPAVSDTALRLDDERWEGGWRNETGYGGRSAVWVYGQGTGYSEMRASFELAEQPAGQARLTVEGMDAEGPAKAEIRISVNGEPIYEGPSPLPDDNYDPATGTWATASWAFDAALLRPGGNLVEIINLSPGAFSAPPFFMLDYADLEIE